MRPPTERPSPREYEVLGLIAGGYSTPEICERLSISENTLKFHKRGLMSRGWRSMEEACAWYGWHRCEQLGHYGLVVAVEKLLEQVRSGAPV